MNRMTRFSALIALAFLFTGATGFAQSRGEAVYKARCQSCHGAEGVPNPGIAKMMGVKPIAAVKAHSLAEMIAITSNGKGKMPAFKGKLTEGQIKESVEYFRSLAK